MSPNNLLEDYSDSDSILHPFILGPHTPECTPLPAQDGNAARVPSWQGGSADKRRPAQPWVALQRMLGHTFPRGDSGLEELPRSELLSCGAEIHPDPDLWEQHQMIQGQG